jgi:molecular chaperone GrpE
VQKETEKQAEVVEAPEAEVVEAPEAEVVEAPEAEVVEAPEAEAAEETEEQAAEAAPDDDETVTERADEDAEVEVEAAEGEAPDDEVEAEEDAIAADLAKAKAEAESYLDDLRRLQADFDNYRKRTLREQTARTASASQALVARLLPVLDNFELAVSAAEQSRDFDGMLKGVEMVLGALREVLEGEGLVKIEAEGKPFDPERHEAVIAVEQEDSDPGTVVGIVRTGYELGGKVLRPAMVKVAK